MTFAGKLHHVMAILSFFILPEVAIWLILG